MKILGLDTSTMISTCAVMEGNEIIGEYTINQNMSHSEKLVPMIKELLDNLNLRPKDIDLYGVALGPGSFTGLRIGVGTVKTLAHLFDKPIVGISTLEALAYNLPYNKTIVPMIDARRNRVYTGIYTWQEEELKTLKEEEAIEIEKLFEILDDYEDIVISGDGSQVYKDVIRENLGDRIKVATAGANICRAS
ncbi:MAG TPA: tRNA (adenosine(37)-N6)-threonylcarbamoyltransferase complex dimerization subunit type 1 TsaB, partial [Tissierellaceae bacterium]|nr:tRNA (adenosine(37)-N6)-threonylcarbamoyltransferase complex dimerization subunit type 1 TsaB [Tissierellaceae bacterium]